VQHGRQTFQVSSSTQFPVLAGRSPTHRHLKYAKRKVYKFVAQEVNRVERETFQSGLLEPCQDEIATSFFPWEIFFHVMTFLDPIALSSFGEICKLLYFASKLPHFWHSHNSYILKQLDMSGLHLSVTEMGSKETFSVLHRHFKTLTQVVVLLKGMSALPDKPSAEANCKQVEELFHEKLNIFSPWWTSVAETVDKELSLLSQTPSRRWKLFGKVLGIQLYLNEGFYAGEKLHFHIHINEYPHQVPKVRCLTTIYHPFIEDSVVKLPILNKNVWEPLTFQLEDVVLELEQLFIDPKFLTNHFTL